MSIMTINSSILVFLVGDKITCGLVHEYFLKSPFAPKSPSYPDE